MACLLHEDHVDFPGQWKKLRKAQSDVAAALRIERPRTIRAMAAQMAGALIAGEKPSSVNFGLRESGAGSGESGLGAKLKEILAPVYSFGQEEIRAEHGRLDQKARKARGFSDSATPESRRASGFGLRTSDFGLVSDRRLVLANRSHHPVFR